MRPCSKAMRALSLWALVGVILAVPSASAAQQFSRPLVSITFDDSNVDGYDIAAPLLNSRGYRGTYYLLTGSMNIDGRLSTAQAKTLVSQGHEVGSHTVTHPDLQTVTAAQLDYELSESRRWIIANVGVPDVPSFAAPYGSVNSTVVAAIKRYYQSDRTVDGSGNLTTDDPYLLSAYALHTQTPLTFVQSLIDRTIAESTWLVLVVHGLTTGPTTDSAYNVSDFTAILDYLKSHNVTVVPVREAVAQMTGSAPPPPAPAPVVSGVNPTSSGTGGGDSITVSGSGFQSGAAVSFGGTASTSVSYVSAATLVAVSPAHAAGTVDVVVRNPDGQSGTLPGAFTYGSVSPPPPPSSCSGTVCPATGSAFPITKWSASNGNTTATITTNEPALVIAMAQGAMKRGTGSATISGGGLTWTPIVQFANDGRVVAAWKATASAPLTNQAVTVSWSGSLQASGLQLLAFQSGQVGVSAISDASGSSPAGVTLGGVTTGSWLYAAGLDVGSSSNRTMGPNNTLDAETTLKSGSHPWLQHYTERPVASAGSYNLTTSAPSSTRWSMVGVEIKP